MASDPSRSREVGKRTSNVSSEVMTTTRSKSSDVLSVKTRTSGKVRRVSASTSDDLLAHGRDMIRPLAGEEPHPGRDRRDQGHDHAGRSEARRPAAARVGPGGG